MLDESELIIEEDRQYDKLSIYLIERRNNSKIHYTIGDDGVLVGHETALNVTEFQPIKPLIVFPLRFGKAFLSLLNDEIERKGINTRKIDMQAGKVELLQQTLEFSNQQLVKFINHFTGIKL